MDILLKTIATLCTAFTSICVVAPSALAQQLWRGTGQIIDGANEGALVELGLTVDGRGNTATILSSYPERGVQIPLNQPVSTREGDWEIYPCDEALCVTFEQNSPRRMVYYRLYRQ